MSLLAELKRRNVFRMAGLYLVASWLIVQVSSTILPMFAAPEWLPRTIVILLAIGFAPAMIFSWVYELTPEGLKRDADVPLEKSIGTATGHRIDRAIIGGLLIALGYFAFDKFVLMPRRDAVSRAAASPKATAPPAPSSSSASSIAVLPFVNMSGDAKNEYFSDGITEEILNALAQVPGLKVAARTSAFAFKGKDPDLRKVGEALDVATVLEGSVQRDGDAVRITAQLIDAHSGYHLWSERYDRQLTSVFAIEDEISRAITEKLKLRLGAAHADSAGTTGDAQAHELFLRGLSLLAARGPGLREAAELFGKAVQIDPQFARAWGALAEAEQLMPGYIQSVGRNEATARAEAAAQRALAIDPNTPSALVAMAVVYMERIEWTKADAAFRRALELAPGDAEAVNQHAQFLLQVGQAREALNEIDRAQQLDPLSAVIGVVRSGTLMSLHRSAEAVAQLESILKAHPDFYPAAMTAALFYLHLGRHADAEVQLRSIARTEGVDAEAKAVLARGVADPGERAAALNSLDDSPANADIRSDQLVYALMLTLLGQRDRAIGELQAYAAQRNSAATGLLWTGMFDSLQGDPRFAGVLASMNLPYRPAETATQ
jgi:TolB-like protein/Tfp pilus assembly protein PilF